MKTITIYAGSADNLAEKYIQAAYDLGEFNDVFATNLVYRQPDLLKAPLYVDVNMAKFVALLIDAINHDASLSSLIDPTAKIRASRCEGAVRIKRKSNSYSARRW